jgi:SAM-dependent methyltransferase
VSQEQTETDRERAFHDDWALTVDPATVDVEAHWQPLGCPESAWIDEQLGDLTGKRVLDLGCGLGEASAHFADRGAIVTATDLSPGMLEVAVKVCALRGHSIETVIADAGDLGVLPADHFDVVYAANLLHHVEIARCVDEVHRILKPGGVAAFWDPLEYNPAIQVYRRMASEVRTIDEHPIRLRDIDTIGARFASVELRTFWLSALLIFFRFFLVDRIHPSADRYWKIVIERQQRHRRFLQFAHRLDRRIIRLLPPLRWWCWNVAIVARKAT